MTEHLAELLLRLSEAGELAILWGRLAKPFLGQEFDRLLARGILSEQAPAEEWDACADCECGHEGRRIQRIDGKLIAACPIDHGSDTVLEPEDLRSFRIDAGSIVHAIAAASGLAGEPALVLPSTWYLGIGPARRALFVVLARRDLAAPGLIAAIQRVENLPITLIGPTLPVTERLRFADAAIHYVPVAEALLAGGGWFVLDERQLMPKASIASRLTVFMRESRILLEGKNLELSMQNFKLMSLLTTELSMGRAVVNHVTIASHLWAVKGRESLTDDAVRNLRNALKKVVGKKSKASPLIRAVAPIGYRLNLAQSEVTIVALTVGCDLRGLAVQHSPDDASRVTAEGRSIMSAETHLSQLERRHKMLEEQIADAKLHSSIDDLKIVELKRQKLQLKDEIERIRLE